MLKQKSSSGFHFYESQVPVLTTVGNNKNLPPTFFLFYLNHKNIILLQLDGTSGYGQISLCVSSTALKQGKHTQRTRVTGSYSFGFLLASDLTVQHLSCCGPTPALGYICSGFFQPTCPGQILLIN